IRFECNQEQREWQNVVILLNGAGCRISNIRIDDPWTGIAAGRFGGPDKLVEVGRTQIENCFIVRAVNSGVEFGTRHSKSSDVSWISNVEVWSDTDNVVTKNGFLFGKNDALIVTNCLAHRCEKGFTLWQQIYPPFGGTWGTFSNCISDYCSNG